MSLRSGRWSASRRRVTAVTATLAGVLLVSGCTLDLHPGVAATVETMSDQGASHTTTVQQNSVDDVVVAACSYIEASNNLSTQPQQIALVDLRANVLNAMIGFQVIDNAATDLGLDINPADVEAAVQVGTLPPGISEDDQAILNSFFYDEAKATIQQATIGAHLKDPTVTSSTGVDQAKATDAQSFIHDQLASAEVDVNPSYGAWNGTSLDVASGSLGDPVSAATTLPTDTNGNTEVSKLPPTQVCG